MYHLIRFFKGYLFITIKGPSKERFLNLCRNHQIYLWNIQYLFDSDTMKACIHIKDYVKVMSILRKTETKATVDNKYGFPFYIPLLKKKTILLFMIFLCFIYLFFASTHIWAFSIQGNHAVTNEEIIQFLSENHIHVGMKKKSFFIHQTAMNLRDSFPEITWVSLKIQGTHCLISIQENSHIEQNTKQMSYSNLVSDKKGKIVSMITRKGVPKVKNGDQVEKNTILVEGAVPVYNEEGEVIKEQYYDADADILILTKEHFSKKIDKNYSQKKFTGNEVKSIAFSIHHSLVSFPTKCPPDTIYHNLRNKGILQMFTPPYYEYSITCKDTNQLQILPDFYLPIYRYQMTEKEYLIQKKVYSESEMETMLLEQLNQFILCLQEKGVQIMGKDVKIEKNTMFSKLTADFVTIESVGISEDIKRE